MGSKVKNYGLGKKLIDKGKKHAPELYKLGTSKIKNKNVKRALNSDVANYIVTETHKKSKRQFRKSFWWNIKNFQKNQ